MKRTWRSAVFGCVLLAPLARAASAEYDFAAMIQPAPAAAKFSDPEYNIWCGYDPGLPLPGPTLRLFDLKNDPGETTNLARREEHRAQTERLVGLLAATLKQTDRQPGLLPKTDDPLEIIAHCVQPRDVEAPPSPGRNVGKEKR